MARGRKRGVHRKRRPRRPLPGMLLHIDGSRHRWFQDERWYDLIVILDDATSEIYYAQLVEEESTLTVHGGAAGGGRAQGTVLRLVQRSRQPFLADPEGGRQGRSASADPGGTRLARVGDSDDSGLLAAGAGALASAALGPGRDGCRRSCGCAASPRWSKPTVSARALRG